ncbi:MAG: polysaccharide deacetylase family protein [Bacillota bacterium]|nr:polysaccharide deacetylase family protein [Bacillota bacterium]
MKIFVLSKDTILIYALVILVLVGMFTVGTMSETVITNATAPSEIPIYRVNTDEKKVALTFDAAWDDKDTDSIISVLEQNGIKASFFMVGGFIDRYPQSVKKFYDNGHEILNHSDSHLHMTDLSKEQVINEINNCEGKIEKVTGKSLKLFRAPYGDYNDKVVALAKEQGYLTIQWDVDSLDWKDLSADEIVARVKSNVKSGSIILCHNGAKNTVAALKILIPELKKEGYQFVKVGDLVYHEDYTIDNSGEQSKY